MNKIIIIILFFISIANANEIAQYVGASFNQEKNSVVNCDFENKKYEFVYGLRFIDNVRFDVSYAKTETAKCGEYKYKYTSTPLTPLFHLYYDFLNKDFTPFIGVNMGLEKGNLDGNNDTGFILGTQIGLSYKILKHLILELAYNYNRIENIFNSRKTGNDNEVTTINKGYKLGMRIEF